METVPLNKAFVAGMYRSHLNSRDRAGTITLVVLIHAALGYAFLNLSGTMQVISREIVPQLINVDIEPPPPPPPVVEVAVKEKPKEKEGAASPQNIKSAATPVVAPKPRIALPVPPPMPVAEKPNTGLEPTQGAAPLAGPGTGAGGNGNGNGAGGSGNGTGGGGSGAVIRPSLITSKLRGRDYPREILDQWPRGAPVFIRFHVDVAGRPFGCEVMRSSGNPAVDQWTCSLAVSKLRYRPATDANGRAVVDWSGYAQEPVGS